MLTYLPLFVVILFVKNIQAHFNSASKLDCGKTSSSKILTLSTPANNIPTDCTYTIRARSAYVCQLRIDFDIDLEQPTRPSESNSLNSPQCIEDVLEIDNFRLCGSDREQHLYVPFNKSAGMTEIKIKIRTAPRNGQPPLVAPNWQIKVTQLECSKGSPLRSFINDLGTFAGNFLPQSWTSPSSVLARTFFRDGFLIAPNGCSQYFPESTGTIKSFNFNNGKGVYPGKMNYAICFRRTTQTQYLRLTPTHFNLGFDPSNSELPVNGNCFPQIHTDDRSEDYLLIPQGEILETGVRASYFCGNSLDKAVTSNAPGPLYMIFNSDDVFYDDVPESGFSFVYNL